MTRRSRLAPVVLAFMLSSMAQQIHTPDVNVQRAAMRKLSFLVGRWSGEARIFRASGPPVELAQTEEAQYKLDGLILMVEGVGRSKSDGKVALQALGLASYDEQTGKYRMRAFNDGRWLDTDLRLADDGKGLAWGFTLGDIRTNSTLRISEKGDWTEVHEITVGSEAPRRFMELTVRPLK